MTAIGSRPSTNTHKPRILTASLDESELRRALTEVRAELTTIYLESETRVVIVVLEDFLGPRITLPPVRWLTGRAFGRNLEIRWHLDGTQFEALALTESEIGPVGWQPSTWNPQLDSVTKTRDVLLAGINSIHLPPEHVLHNAQPNGGLWVEETIPRPLNYPVSDAKTKRVMLRCIDYLSRGLVVITRLAELLPYHPPS